MDGTTIGGVTKGEGKSVNELVVTPCSVTAGFIVVED